MSHDASALTSGDATPAVAASRKWQLEPGARAHGLVPDHCEQGKSALPGQVVNHVPAIATAGQGPTPLEYISGKPKLESSYGVHFVIDEDFQRFVAQAAEAAAVMKSLGHEGRLRLLCYLAEAGEVSAGELTARVGLSQSALSQHLAKLRAEGLVTTRKQSQSVFYRIAEPKLLDLLQALHRIYCPTPGVNNFKELHND